MKFGFEGSRKSLLAEVSKKCVSFIILTTEFREKKELAENIGDISAVLKNNGTQINAGG